MNQLVFQPPPLIDSNGQKKSLDRHMRKSSTTRSHLRLPSEHPVHLPPLQTAHSYIRIPSTTTLHASATRKTLDSHLVPHTSSRSALPSYGAPSASRKTLSSQQLSQQFRRITSPTLPKLHSPRRNRNEPLPSIQLQQIVGKLEALAAQQQTTHALPSPPVATTTAQYCISALRLMQQMMESKEDKQSFAAVIDLTRELILTDEQSAFSGQLTPEPASHAHTLHSSTDDLHTTPQQLEHSAVLSPISFPATQLAYIDVADDLVKHIQYTETQMASMHDQMRQLELKISTSHDEYTYVDELHRNNEFLYAFMSKSAAAKQMELQTLSQMLETLQNDCIALTADNFNLQQFLQPYDVVKKLDAVTVKADEPQAATAAKYDDEHVINYSDKCVDAQKLLDELKADSESKQQELSLLSSQSDALAVACEVLRQSFNMAEPPTLPASLDELQTARYDERRRNDDLSIDDFRSFTSIMSSVSGYVPYLDLTPEHCVQVSQYVLAKKLLADQNARSLGLETHSVMDILDEFVATQTTAMTEAHQLCYTLNLLSTCKHYAMACTTCHLQLMWAVVRDEINQTQMYDALISIIQVTNAAELLRRTQHITAQLLHRLLAYHLPQWSDADVGWLVERCKEISESNSDLISTSKLLADNGERVLSDMMQRQLVPAAQSQTGDLARQLTFDNAAP